MHRKRADVDAAAAHTARLAWWAAFVTTAVIALAIGFVRTADAAVLPSSPLLSETGGPELEAEAEEPEVEWEESPCELEAEALLESGAGGADCEAGGEEVDGTPPQCRLESVDAAVSADLLHRRLHLAVRYRASMPAAVTLAYSLRGTRGALTLPVERGRFGFEFGVFRAGADLSAAQARRVAAARSFRVQVRPAGVPGYCRGYLDEDLTVRRGGPAGPIWVDSDSTFRRARHA